MAPNGKPKTFAELLEERQKEWNAKQAQMAADIRALHEQLAKMPDVANAPPPGSARDFRAEGVQCPCGGTDFFVRRWTTVNGLRHRMEAACIACSGVRTWDWTLEAWLD